MPHRSSLRHAHALPYHTLVHDTPAEQELMPGDVGFARRGQRLKTLLGSCVAVILSDPQRTVATMCHIVHSSQPNSANLHNTAYAACAMDRMFHLMRISGFIPNHCEAFVYGGGNMFPQHIPDGSVGLRNAQWAWDFLHDHHIPIAGHDLGGTFFRKLSWTVGHGAPELTCTDVQTGSNHER